MTAQSINNIIEKIIIEGTAVQKAIVGRDIARLVQALKVWENKVFILEGSTDKITRRNIESWMNDFEKIWDKGMTDIVYSSGYTGFGITQFGAGLIPNKEAFLEIYNIRIQQILSKEYTNARLLRNSLQARFGKNYQPFYDQYESFLAESQALGMPLKKINEKFLNKSIAHQNLSLVDRSGRKWKANHYSMMYSRTRSGEIQNDYALSEMDNLGMDVVQVSRHNTLTPICQQYEGKFYSKNGETDGIPVLSIKPPFHPNCLHILLPRKGVSTKTMKTNNTRQTKKFSDNLSKLTDKEKAYIKRQEKYIIKNR